MLECISARTKNVRTDGTEYQSYPSLRVLPANCQLSEVGAAASIL